MILIIICLYLLINIVYSKNNKIPQSSNYRWVYQYINITNVKLVFEVGSRDIKDGNNLAHHFNCPVYSFEANPDNYDEMIINNVDDRVKFIRTAVSDIDGYITFYPYNLTLYNNMR